MANGPAGFVKKLWNGRTMYQSRSNPAHCYWPEETTANATPEPEAAPPPAAPKAAPPKSKVEQETDQ